VPNAGLKLTTGTFIRPSGKPLHRNPESKPSDDWGVRPDEGLERRASPELNRQLRERWLDQTLRPGPSNRRLPLDDPDADPQRRAGVEALRATLKLSPCPSRDREGAVGQRRSLTVAARTCQFSSIQRDRHLALARLQRVLAPRARHRPVGPQ